MLFRKGELSVPCRGGFRHRGGIFLHQEILPGNVRHVDLHIYRIAREKVPGFGKDPWRSKDRARRFVVKRIPGVGQIYGTIRSLLDPLSHPESRPFREAVWVDVAPGLRCMGFVTSSPFAEAPGEPPRVNVYLPMSHPYVGYVLTIEPDRLRPCEAGFEEVVSYHFSCGSALPKGYKGSLADSTATKREGANHG